MDDNERIDYCHAESEILLYVSRTPIITKDIVKFLQEFHEADSGLAMLKIPYYQATAIGIFAFSTQPRHWALYSKVTIRWYYNFLRNPKFLGDRYNMCIYPKRKMVL